MFWSRGGSRAAATSKMEHFVLIVNGWKPLTIITKRSILDVAAVIDPPLLTVKDRQIWSCIQHHLYLPAVFQIVEKKWKLDILGVFFDILDILSEWITWKKVVIWEQFWKFIFFFCSIVKNKQFWLLVTKAPSIKTGLFVMPSYRNDVELRDFIFFNCFY